MELLGLASRRVLLQLVGDDLPEPIGCSALRMVPGVKMASCEAKAIENLSSRCRGFIHSRIVYGGDLKGDLVEAYDENAACVSRQEHGRERIFQDNARRCMKMVITSTLEDLAGDSVCSQ